jgi:hypothetical protein
MSDTDNTTIKPNSAADPVDEMLLHRFLEGRLDSKERAEVDETLRLNAAARRTLDALREEQKLIREALEARVEPSQRISDKVLFTLYAEERKHQQVVRNRRWRRQISVGVGLAASVALCLWLIKPRDAAGQAEAGTVASLTTRNGDHRALTHDSRIYEGDSIAAAQGQFVRLHLANDSHLDIDEYTRIVIDKGGLEPVLRMQAGRLGVDAVHSRHTVVVYLPQGSVTIPSGAWAEVWLPQPSNTIWPGMLASTPPPAHAVASEKAPLPAVVTVFRGAISFSNDKTPTGTTLKIGERATFTSQTTAVQKIDLEQTHAVACRDSRSCWNTQENGPQDRPIAGLLKTQNFVELGQRLKMDVKVPAIVPEALKGLQDALEAKTPAERADKLASGQAALRRACEMLSVDDARRPYGRMLEGLAHAQRALILIDLNGERDPAASSAFEAAAVAFEEALRTNADDTQKQTWVQSMSAPGSSLALSDLTSADQSALLAKFNHAVSLYWLGRAGDTHRAAEAADEFDAVHAGLGRHIEALAARYGEGLTRAQAGEHEKAITAYEDVLALSLAGCSENTRKIGDGIKQAALLALAQEYVAAGQLDKAKLVAQDFLVLYPLDENSPVLAQIQREIDKAAK